MRLARRLEKYRYDDSQFETKGTSLLFSMKALKTARPAGPTPKRKITESQSATGRTAEELMELAVEAARSRHLPDFLEQFVLRATSMLGASWGGVAVYLGRETKFYAMPGSDGSTFSSAEEWVLATARECDTEIETHPVPNEIAAVVPSAEQPEVVIFVRIASSDNEK